MISISIFQKSNQIKCYLKILAFIGALVTECSGCKFGLNGQAAVTLSYQINENNIRVFDVVDGMRTAQIVLRVSLTSKLFSRVKSNLFF